MTLLHRRNHRSLNKVKIETARIKSSDLKNAIELGPSLKYHNPRKTTVAAFPFSVQGYSNGPVCWKLWTDWAEDQVTLSEGVLEQNPGWGDGTNWTKGDLPYKFN